MASVCIVGAGSAGLITAKTLLDDGFEVHVLTRDRSPGGIWAEERVYPGLSLNKCVFFRICGTLTSALVKYFSVHGEFRFSCLPMPPPRNAKVTGGRLAGDAMRLYMEKFSARFLEGHVRYQIEVLNISRHPDSGKWIVDLKDIQGSVIEQLTFDKIVLCTGGCSRAYTPPSLSPMSAEAAGFSGLVFHSSQFKAHMESLLMRVQPNSGVIILIGGGKSAQDIAACLVNQDRNVTMVFDKTDAFVAVPVPLPDFIRKSRFLAVLSPHINLRTRLERFLHTTKFGSMITRGFWSFLTWSSFFTFSIPASSPFRNAHSLFWGIRTNDEGVGSPTGFFSLIKEKKINVLSPSRAAGFAANGKGILLEDGRTVDADAVFLCTGFTSSWNSLFDEATRDELGLGRQLPSLSTDAERKWDDYISLKNPPTVCPENTTAASSIYRGLVPARNLCKRDFAVNGSVFTTNNGYTFEVASHWISSYFLSDPFLSLPSTADDALVHTQMTAAWLRRRYPGMLSWVNESYSSGIAFWNYPQLVDDLLEDMGLPIMRGGRNWFTWPFKVIDLREIEHLHDERLAKRLLSDVDQGRSFTKSASNER
ncbi:FAD/NAD-P-binding domain-containing protein [Phellopilus nigrolimitatus]|nr:FAD/NAD-P-binding domain-containing protein [Phellopilus nigrolimitatus]